MIFGHMIAKKIDPHQSSYFPDYVDAAKNKSLRFFCKADGFRMPRFCLVQKNRGRKRGAELARAGFAEREFDTMVLSIYCEPIKHGTYIRTYEQYHSFFRTPGESHLELSLRNIQPNNFTRTLIISVLSIAV